MSDYQQMPPQPVFVNTENENSLLKYQIEVEGTLEVIRMMLLNITFDYQTKEYKFGTPLYPKNKINQIMNIVKSFINKELVLSGFSDLTLSSMIRTGMDTLSQYLLKISNEEFCLCEKEEINNVINTILNHAITNMKRAVGFKTLDHTGKAKITEYTSPSAGDFNSYPIREQRYGGKGWR